jgi:hypothetical protein
VKEAAHQETLKPTVALPNEIFKYSVKRIKKKINDFILNSYQELFFTNAKSPEMPAEFQSKKIAASDFLNHPKILQKAIEELKFCEEPAGTSATDLISDCLTELEEKGFLNLVGD